MRISNFIKYLFKTFPTLIYAEISLLIFGSFLDAATIFTVAPIVDFLVNTKIENTSHVTQKSAEVIALIGLPVTLTSFLIVFLVLSLLRSGIQIFIGHIIIRIKYAVYRDITMGTFEDLFNAKWYFFCSIERGKLLNTFVKEIGQVADSFGTIARFYAALFQTCIFIVVPFYISWKLTSSAIIFAGLLCLPFLLLSKLSYRLGRLGPATGNKLNLVIHESFSLAKIILGFANQNKTAESLDQAFGAHSRAITMLQTLTLSISLTYQPLGLSAVILSLILGLKLGVNVAELSVIIYSLIKIIPLLGQLAGHKNIIAGLIPSYEQITDLRDLAKKLKQKTGSKIMNGINEQIAIEGFSFTYPGQSPTLLDINMRIPKGKMIAIVGESGAGKSTLIDAIMGFNEPMSGQIKIDEVPLQDFSINSYRKRIGFVPQESVLFNMTIADNLRWANGHAADEEIKKACQTANAHKFIEEFPEGYNTYVGDRGVRLSGGQIQRIALARAIIRNPDLLILDEATSSLDTHSERLIQQAVENITKETTIVVVAHRLSTIVKADYIYVLEKGRMVEEGHYDELMKQNGQFYQMVKSQG